MAVKQRLERVLEEHRYYQRRGAFFGGVKGRPWGSGILLSSCPIPFYDEETSSYLTGRGCVCILSHECDLDPGNDRVFNDKMLVVPAIDFQKWFELIVEIKGLDAGENIAKSMVRDEVHRVFFLPAIPGAGFEYGALLYLNEITNVQVRVAEADAKAVCSLTQYSHGLLDYKLKNHLFREKSAPPMRIA